MGFDKNKTTQTAERYLAQGRISAAINQYKSIVDNDSSEVNTQNMLGDLYIKTDDRKAAIECYKQAAECYNLNGFEKKAIAVYNKIHRLEPNSIDISIKLAELYQVRGSLAEAREHYEKVASAYENKGDKVEALTIWEKLADIAPKNTEIYIKIADFYWNNNQKEEASTAYIEAGVRLAENEKHEEAVAAFAKALEVVPEDIVAVRGYVGSQMSLGYPEEAIKILDEIYSHNPNNADVVFLLVDCYLDMEEEGKAEVVLVDLIANEPKAYAKLLDIVDFHLKHDDLESTVRILSMISEQLLVSQKPDRLLDLLNEIAARNPEQIQALRMLVRYHTWHKNEKDLRRVLDHLLEAASYLKSIEDERYAITQLLLLSPREDKYISRLKKINGVDTEDGDKKKRSSVPTFEAFSGLLTGNDETLSETAQEYTVDEPAEITLTEADLQPVRDEESAEKKGLDIDEQIENLRFYIDQGYVEIAEQTIKELDEEHGEREEFDEIRENLAEYRKTTPSETDSDEQAVSGEELSDEQAAIEDQDEESLISGNQGATVDEYVIENASGEELESPADKSADDQVEEEEPEEIEPQAETEIKSVSEAKTETEAVSLENAEELDATVPEEGEAEPETDETLAVEKEEAVEEVISSETVESDEEYENHYHHAVAYKEMGLLGDAIREFQSAIDCIDPNDGSERFLQCCTLLGHCYIEQNSPADAIKWFDQAFKVEGLDENEKTALNYELGNAYAQDCNFQKAVALFETVQSEDADYRDVGERLEECRERTSLVAA